MPDTKPKERLLLFSVWGIVFGGLYLCQHYNYLLFHSISELFSIIIACAIFLVYWNARGFIQNNYFLFISIAYLFVGFIETFHMLSFKGMTIFADHDANLPTQLWVGARYLQSLSLLVAPLFIKRRLRLDMALLTFIVLFVGLFLSIFHWPIFPTCFVEGQGLTPFKIVSEYIISFLFLFAIFFLIYYKQHFDRNVLNLILLSILLTIVSEIMFTFYSHAYDLFNLMGHFIKIVAYWLIYKALLQIGLRRPYSLLFREIKQSESRYYSLFSNMMDGYALHKMVYDIDGNPVDYIFLAINEAFEEIIGKSRQEIIGKSVTEVFPGIKEDHLDWIRTYGRVVSTGKPIRLEQYSKVLDKWYALVAYKPEEHHFVSIVQDITQRKKAELKLRESKKHLENRIQERTAELLKSKEVLELIIEHIPVMLCFFSPDGNLKLFNNAFEDLSRQTTGGLEQIVTDGPHCSLQSVICEDVWHHITRPPTDWKDFTIRLKNGDLLETSWRSILCPEGYSIAIGIDISDRKQMEQKIRDSIQSLKRSNQELEDFAFIASHDLHEPLRKVRTFGDILALKFGNVLDTEGQNYINRMQAAAERMQDLLDSLLIYSRVSTKEAPFDDVDLAAAVREALSNLEVLIFETGASFEIKKLPRIHANRVQIVQLFQNIIGNALKFHRKDIPPIVTIETRINGNKDSAPRSTIDIVVKDNGIGFDEKFLDRIFNPFQKLHGRQDYPGLGMGLAISRKIVGRHSGSIQARSIPGKGSSFIITLPKHQTSPKKAEISSPPL